MKNTLHIVFLGLIILLLNSCKILYPNLMFKTDKEDIPSHISDSVLVPQQFEEFVIAPGDKITFEVYTNKGYNLLNIINISSGRDSRITSQEIEYLVMNNGYVRLPTIDTVQINGLKISTAERMLEKEYDKYFEDPLVKIKITNRRVLVFQSGGETSSRGQVVPIEHENTSLIEVLAKAGGIVENGKAYKIKIIRGNLSNPQIKEIDLSSIESMRAADLTVRSNDIIYIEPALKLTSSILKELSPIMGIINGAIAVYLLYDKLTEPED